MSTVIIEQLQTLRERMSDPNRVVLDPENLYEAADGSTDAEGLAPEGLYPADYRKSGIEPARACLLGWSEILLDAEAGSLLSDSVSTVGAGTYTGTLRTGRALAVIDAAIANAEVS